MKKENFLEEHLRKTPKWHFIGSLNGAVEKEIEARGLTHLIRICDGYALDKIQIEFTFESSYQLDSVIDDLDKFKKFLQVHKYCFGPRN